MSPLSILNAPGATNKANSYPAKSLGYTVLKMIVALRLRTSLVVGKQQRQLVDPTPLHTALS